MPNELDRTGLHRVIDRLVIDRMAATSCDFASFGASRKVTVIFANPNGTLSSGSLLLTSFQTHYVGYVYKVTHKAPISLECDRCRLVRDTFAI